ncbi:MAG: PLP-dependent aminotransferase family protein [Chloroflexales bacterium]|nr:PLP-dependent aminotransferase family protein [Chloroflexales bacterium]
MNKLPTALTSPLLALDQSSTTPLYRQLYDGLRQAILDGRIVPGARLPATRALATELGVSRNTVMSAFDQLFAEGYLEGRVGDGTYVTRTLPDTLLHAGATTMSAVALQGTGRRLSRRGAMLAATPVSTSRERGQVGAFAPGIPAIDAFPFETMATLAARRWRNLSSELLGYGDPAGYRPLRDAIAAYLGAARGVRCSAEQVIIVGGSQQGLDLTARVLLDSGNVVWMEDPGYLGARGALRAAGAEVIPVPLDAEGLDVVAGNARNAAVRLVYITPSHQYPTGVTMSLTRRLALLEWATHHDAWIIEDDYDSEYRYAGRPLAALQGLDRTGRVIYLGTFSKVLCPAIRLGYLVAPPDLVDAFVAARALADRHAPTIDQAVLTDFIVEGHFARHIRRMRALYAERQAILLEAIERELSGLLDARPAEAGMHLLTWLPDGINDQLAAQRAAEYGVIAPPLSAYNLAAPLRSGVLLGYAGVKPHAIEAGVKQLAAAWAKLCG